MEPKIEDRNEPKVEIGHEPGEYVSPPGFQRPRSHQSASIKKWIIGLIIPAVIGVLVLGTWVTRPWGLFFNKPATESPEPRALKTEVEKLKSGNDLMIKDLQSLKEGQKKAEDQLGKLQEEVKSLKEHQTLLEKKAEAPVAKKPGSQTIVYKVKKGDTLQAIARKFDVKSEDIRRWNHLPANNQPKPGQKITIHSPSES
jgi:LysM repeat protein